MERNVQEYYKFVNDPLPYPYQAMEPFISIETMYLHHDKLLQNYVDKLNNTLSDYPFLQNFTLEQLLRNLESIPTEIRTAVRHNAGGVYNHRFYFNGLAENPKGQPQGSLAQAIRRQFGTYDEFKEKFSDAALSVFGSGYAWLVSDEGGDLRIITTANQDTPLARNLIPVLNIDVWEHAYFLQCHNQRKNYVEDWFKIVNWEMAEQQYQTCRGRKV